MSDARGVTNAVVPPDVSAVQSIFADVLEFSDWALATTTARIEKRRASSREQICAFYDAIVPRIDAVLELLSSFPLEEMPAGVLPLYYIALSVAEVAPYVEWFEGENRSPSLSAGGLRDFKLIGEPTP